MSDTDRQGQPEWPVKDGVDGVRLTAALARSVAVLAQRAPAPARPLSRAAPQVYGPDAAADSAAYRRWRVAHSEHWAEQRRAIGRRLEVLSEPPSIDVVVGAGRIGVVPTERCLASLSQQDVPELVVRTGDAAGATADFLAFVEPEDELEPGTLAAVLVYLAGDPTVDALYTDEDQIDDDGGLSRPRFKPGWSPDQLLSHDYVGGLLVVRRSLYERTGGYGWDLELRISEAAAVVAHLPIVAYHRRRPVATEGVTLEDALLRRGEDAVVEGGLTPATFRVRRIVRDRPLVSVVIPFQDGAELLRRCVVSLDECGGWDRWEALLVDNLSWEPATVALLGRLTRDRRCRLLRHPAPFNWAAINNEGAKQASGSHLLFLNADVAGRSPGWMRALLEHAQRPEVGAVGARLVYPDGSVQHAGVVLGLGGGVAWHAFAHCPGEESGYLDQVKVIRNCSAVTGACLMVRRETFESLGGFDETLAVAYNDVDFCLRAWERGYRVVYTPFAELVHDESAFRGQIAPESEAERAMIGRWGDRIRNDPFFNPNLDRMRTEFALG